MKFMLVTVFMCMCTWTFAIESVVENDRKPKGKVITIEFTEDLRFGADEEDDNFLWADPSSVVDTNSKGHFFLADIRERRVLEFDSAGGFVRVVADKGQGPGELQALADLSVLKDGRLIALNAGPGVLPKLLFFDNTGKFEKDLAPQGFSKIVVSSEFAPDGKYFGAIYLGFNMESGVMTFKTGVMDLNFEVLHQFSEKPQKFDMNAFSTPQGITKFISDLLTNAYKGTGMMTFDKDGYGYSAVSNEYKITKWSPDLKSKVMIIKRKHKPIANTPERIEAVAENSLDAMRQGPGGNMITDEMVQQVIKRTELPIVVNPVNGIITMEDGKILIVHDANEATGVQQADIYSKKGDFIGQVTMDNWAFANRSGQTSMIFKNGFAYCLETDEEDENRIVRYKYQIKKI